MVASGKQYYTEFKSIEEDIINIVSHNPGIFRDESVYIYYNPEDYIRSTSYTGPVNNLQTLKEVCDIFRDLMDQYAGMDKWESDTKKKYSLLHTRKWKGHSNFTLERFLQQHWNAYIYMQACNEHVRYQLPNEYTRIGCVLNTI